MNRLRTTVVLALVMGAVEVFAAKPAVVFGLWINQLLPDDISHFESIKGPTRDVTVTIRRAGASTVKRQRVNVKGDFSVNQVSALLQEILETDEHYWSTRDPLGIGVVGDASRTIVNTSWGSGSQEGGGSSYVYTLENGKWRSLYRCCRNAD
jgi:hypothetical protein